MSTPTYTLINQITLAVNSTSVVFSAIPQNFRDLVLVGSGFAVVDTLPVAQFNGDGSSSYQYVTASATSAIFSGASAQPWAPMMDNTSASGGFVNFVCNIFDYTQTNKHKSVLARGNQSNINSTLGVHMSATRWANTAPITSISLRTFSGGNYGAGTVFSLYGIVG